MSGFVTGYLGAGISNAVTSRLGSTVIGNTLLNSSSTVTRVATNAFIGASSETVSGIGIRFAGTMITSGGDIKESAGSAFDVHNIAFDAAFGGVFGGARGFKQPAFADGMSPEDAARYDDFWRNKGIGSEKTYNEFVKANPGATIDDYFDLVQGQSPWPQGYDAYSKITKLKEGDKFYMVLDNGQKVTQPGGFGILEEVPSVDFARNDYIKYVPGSMRKLK